MKVFPFKKSLLYLFYPFQQNQLNNAQFSSVKIDTVNGNGEAAHMTEQTDAKVTRLNQVVVTLEEKNRELAEKLQKSVRLFCFLP